MRPSTLVRPLIPHLLLAVATSTHFVSAAQSEAQSSAGAARAPSHPTIPEIEKLAEDAFDVGLKLQFDEADKRFEAALKAAAQRFPERHWIVRRVKAKQRYVAHIASLAQPGREAAQWADVLFFQVRRGENSGHVFHMHECVKLAKEHLQKVGGGDTSERITLNKWLAATYREERKFEEEERALKEQQRLVSKLYGEEDPEYRYIFSQLATNLWKRGKLSEAQKLFAQVRWLLSPDVEGNEPYCAEALAAEGNYWLHVSELDKAESAFRAALAQVVESSPGNVHLRAGLLGHLALVHSEQRKPVLAKRELSQALEIIGKLPSDDLKARGALLVDVGEAEYHLQQYGDAELHLALALSELEAIAGVGVVNGAVQPLENERAGAACALLGQIYENAQQHQKAQEALSNALRIYRRNYGDSDEITRGTINTLARVLKKAGKLEEAERLLSGSRAP